MKWKIISLSLVIASSIAMVRMADADVVVRPMERRFLASNHHLFSQRLLHLEKKVDRLQKRIRELETQDVYVEPWTCYIETPFDGLFTVTRPTRTEAKAMTIAKCMKRSGKT